MYFSARTGADGSHLGRLHHPSRQLLEQSIHPFPCHLVEHELRQQGAEIPLPLSAEALHCLLQRLAFPFPVVKSQLAFDRRQIRLHPLHQRQLHVAQIA